MLECDYNSMVFGGLRGCFCTALSVRDYKWNLVTEIIGTFLLVYCLFHFALNTNETGLSPGIGPILAGVLVWAVGLSFGGATAYAINPARDLGPRIAYTILPLKGKGDSDWSYSWVPVVGPLIASVLAALLHISFMRLIN